MTDLIQMSDVEIAAVAGGFASVSATQTNNSTVNQTASATNSGTVSATNSGGGSGNTAAAAGAEASNFAEVSQVNVARATNHTRIRL
jgi:hypothetical protein